MKSLIDIRINAKRLLSFMLAVVLMSHFNINAYAQPSVSAASAVLIDANTGEILFAKNENEKRSMASTTKIMTALLALESDKLEQEIVVTDEMVQVEGTSMGLRPQDKVTLETLVYGMLLQSGNDAANAVALTLSENQTEFAVMMNDRAKQIGTGNTNFVTPSGLDDEQHYSTAYDMAIIAKEAMSNDKFAHIASQKSAKVVFGNPPIQHELYNHNRLLSMYEGTIGIKTGFTKKSGRCLVSCAQRNGVRLIAVTLKAPDDWNDHMEMYDYGFSLYDERNIDTVSLTQTVPLVGGYTKNLELDCTKINSFMLTEQQLDRVEITVTVPQFAYAPVVKGQLIGYADIKLEDIILKRVYLQASKDYAYKSTVTQKSILDRLFEWLWNDKI